jgi:ubiquinone/menaquinone biosynthesis C-methylase UbiE/transcription elongation factor Elf1
MSNKLIYREHCPICNHSEFEKHIDCVDYTVSNETFTIVKCKSCGFHFTNPVPIESEIGNYYKSDSYVSHSATKKGLIFKIYHLVRSYTLKQKVKLITTLSKGKNHLDIGAATGHFLNASTKAGFNSIGLEPDKDARQFAQSTFNVNIKPLEHLYEIKENAVDVITMWHVLEHVYNLRKDLDQITKILKDDGVMIVAVPNMGCYDAKKYKEYWAGYDVPIHLYHFQPNDIKNLFEQYNMSIEQILPMKFDSYYVSMLSEQYKGGNIIKAFWTGFVSNFKATNETYTSQIYILRKNAK